MFHSIVITYMTLLINVGIIILILILLSFLFNKPSLKIAALNFYSFLAFPISIIVVFIVMTLIEKLEEKSKEDDAVNEELTKMIEEAHSHSK